jgi:hypothetical protein
MATALSLTRGDSATLQATVTQLGASGLTGSTLYFMAKRDYADPDASAIISHQTGSGVTVTQAGGTNTPGIAQIALAPADTSSLPAYALTLVWDLVMVDGSGNHTTVASGTLAISPDVLIAN